MVDISVANIEDVPRLIELMEQLTKNSIADENLAGNQFGKIVDKACHVIVLRECGSHGKSSVLATGSLWTLHKFFQKRPTGLIEDVVVDENCRGFGYGKMIIDNLVEEAKRKNCYRVQLSCSEYNEPFYEKCGFHKHETEMRIDL